MYKEQYGCLKWSKPELKVLAHRIKAEKVCLESLLFSQSVSFRSCDSLRDLNEPFRGFFARECRDKYPAETIDKRDGISAHQLFNYDDGLRQLVLNLIERTCFVIGWQWCKIKYTTNACRDGKVSFRACSLLRWHSGKMSVYACNKREIWCMQRNGDDNFFKVRLLRHIGGIL